MMNRKRIWKETVVAESRYYPAIYLEGLRKSTKNLMRAGAAAEI
jgi:hypothetical protein